jgi:hypothetical protein
MTRSLPSSSIYGRRLLACFNNARHYWNPTGPFGLVYGPEATWGGDLPPRPELLKKARELLAKLPTPAAR